MANTPPGPPGSPPPVLDPSDPLGLLHNGTIGRISTMQFKSAEVLLAEAQQRYAAHTSGKYPLPPRESLALRAEIDRLSQIVHPGVPNMWADYTWAEKAYMAEDALERRVQANNLGMIAAGPVFAILPMIGRFFNAPEEVVENLGQINFDVASAFTPGEGRISAEPIPGRPAVMEPLGRGPVEPRPVEPRPVEPRPAEPRPAEAKPAEPKPAEPKPAEAKPAEPPPKAISTSVTPKKKVIVKEGKWDYFFGRVKSNKHNEDRSLQNKRDLEKLGITEEAGGRDKLTKIFEEGLDAPETARKATEYGVTIARTVEVGDGALSIGYFYPEGILTATPEVTSIIPKL